MHQPRLYIELPDVRLVGDLLLPDNAQGLVVFVHGSGSSRLSPRNQEVARYLGERGLATLLFDLLSEAEERIDRITCELRFDIPLLTRRLVGVLDWIAADPDLTPLPVGLFGASTGAAAAKGQKWRRRLTRGVGGARGGEAARARTPSPWRRSSR